MREWILKMNQLSKEKKPFLFILDFDLQTPIIEELNTIGPDKILYFLNGVSNSQESSNQGIKEYPKIHAKPVKYDVFLEKFNKVQSEIRAGNTYLLNLTFEHPVRINSGLRDIFFLSRAKYKLWIKDKFVLFSPETFVKIINGKISTYPMKGTAEKKDEKSGDTLLRDEKESAEHATITDLLRNDLGRVAENIRVTRYRYIDEIITEDKTILQLSSEITGELKAYYREHPGDLFNELLPAGSISGAPKKKTVEIIKATEDYKRGFYTGVFGLFDGIDFDSCVMIRFIENRNGELFYKSGGGITYMSEPQKEYQELIQKIYVPVH